MAEKGEDNSVKGNSAPVQIVRTGSGGVAHGIILALVFAIAFAVAMALFAVWSAAHGT